MGKGLSITAFVFSLLFFIPFCPLVGLILGIIALVKAKKPEDLKGLAIAAIVISSIGILIGILGFFIMLNLFLKFTEVSNSLG